MRCRADTSSRLAAKVRKVPRNEKVAASRSIARRVNGTGNCTRPLEAIRYNVPQQPSTALEATGRPSAAASFRRGVKPAICSDGRRNTRTLETRVLRRVRGSADLEPSRAAAEL